LKTSGKKLIAGEFNVDDAFSIEFCHDSRIPKITNELLNVLSECKDISLNNDDLVEIQITGLALTVAYVIDNMLIDEAGLEGRMNLIDCFALTIKKNLETFYKSRLKNNQIGH
jgi:hypothetical protein